MSAIVTDSVPSQQLAFVAGLHQQLAAKTSDLIPFFNGLMDQVYADGKTEFTLPGGRKVKVPTGELTVEQKIDALNALAPFPPALLFDVASKCKSLILASNPDAVLREIPAEFEGRITFDGQGKAVLAPADPE